jgi:predicted ABC-type ATPase
VSSEGGCPRLLIIAGPNGSGKTTLTTRLREFGLDFGEYVNADEIALSFPNSPDRDRLAQIEADNRRRRLLNERRSFSFETVMSHPSKIDEMREAKALGFHFTFYFVAVNDPSINLKRVQHRVAMGGHDVPPDRIVARYHRTMALMPKAVLLADQSFIFDNSDVRIGPRLVAEFRGAPEELELVEFLGLSQSYHDFGDLIERARGWVQTHLIQGVRQEAARLGVRTNLP